MLRAPLLLLALLLGSGPPPGGSEPPRGKQKALRQREVAADTVRGAKWRGRGPEVARGRGGAEGRRAAGSGRGSPSGGFRWRG